MAHEEDPPEDELENRQGALYPVGKALRRTFDADNHDSLGTELTGLMLQLARIDPDASPLPRGALPPTVSPAPPAPTAATPPVAATGASWWRATFGRLAR